MARIAIGWGDRIAAGTVMAGSALATLPASNLQTPPVSRVWRATASSDYVVADLGAVFPVGWTAMLGCNLSAGGTVRVRGSTSDATGAAGDAHDSGILTGLVDPAFRKLVHIPAATFAARYLRIDFADLSLSYVEAGYWLAGTIFRPARNYQFGADDLTEDLSTTSRSANGSEWSEERARVPGFSCTLPALTRAEKDTQLMPLSRASGTTRDVMVCKDPASSNLGRDTVVGRPRNVVTAQEADPDRYVAKLEVFDRV